MVRKDATILTYWNYIGVVFHRDKMGTNKKDLSKRGFLWQYSRAFCSAGPFSPVTRLPNLILRKEFLQELLKLRIVAQTTQSYFSLVSPRYQIAAVMVKALMHTSR